MSLFVITMIQILYFIKSLSSLAGASPPSQKPGEERALPPVGLILRRVVNICSDDLRSNMLLQAAACLPLLFWPRAISHPGQALSQWDLWFPPPELGQWLPAPGGSGCMWVWNGSAHSPAREGDAGKERNSNREKIATVVRGADSQDCQKSSPSPSYPSSLNSNNAESNGKLCLILQKSCSFILSICVFS